LSDLVEPLKKAEAMIPFGKLTQPLLKNKNADPLLLANQARMEVQDLRGVVEEKDALIDKLQVKLKLKEK